MSAPGKLKTGRSSSEVEAVQLNIGYGNLMAKVFH